MNHLMATYKPLMTIERGKGCYIWDTEGQKYFDTISGVAVCNLGHSHPSVTRVIQEQAELLIHCSNLVSNPHQEKLANTLCALSGLSNVFFCNSGAEAVEAAMKLARLFGHKKGLADPKIIVMERAFHGRTLAALSASGNPKIQAGFTPLVEGFIRAPFDNIPALRTLLERHKDVVAIMLEPIQGEGGMRVPAPHYLEAVRQLCDEFDCLMILDEIQGGMGRTGKWFSYQHADIQPDIITIAKGLANGIPIGACIAGDKAQDLFQYGNHGSTFGGNALATRVASEVIRIIKGDHLLENATQRGAELMKQLREELSDLPQVIDIRGQGLWIGIELDRPCADTLVAAAKKQGLLLNMVQDSIIRLAPPIIITAKEVSLIVEKVSKLVRALPNKD